MRVGIDLRPLQSSSGRRGVGTYTRHLVRALRQARGPGEEIVGIVAPARGGEDLPEGADRVVAVTGPRRGITWLDPLRLPPLLRRQAVDVYHAVFYPLPVRRPGRLPCIATVHDLTPRLYPRALSPRQRLVLRTAFRRAACADRVIVVSRATGRDLERLYHVPAERVEVIYPGVDPVFSPGPDPGDVGRRRQLGIESSYLLHVGGYDPVKNLPAALAALSRLRDTGYRGKLVVAGAPGPHRRRFEAEVRRRGLDGSVLATGWVPIPDLVALYRGAEVVLYPSRHEGFGLPPLEAMACGAPVVASRTGSLPEVLGDACALVAPDDHGALAAATARLLSDPAARRGAAERGRRQAAGYRWEVAAERTLAVYRSVHAAAATGGGPWHR